MLEQVDILFLNGVVVTMDAGRNCDIRPTSLTHQGGCLMILSIARRGYVVLERSLSSV